MALLSSSVSSVVRAGVDKLLKSDAVMGQLERLAGRYADILSLRCREKGGLEAVIRIKGFHEDVRVELCRVELGEDMRLLTIREMHADREGVDALLQDAVCGRSFDIPEKVRPFAGMLRAVFSS